MSSEEKTVLMTAHGTGKTLGDERREYAESKREQERAREQWLEDVEFMLDDPHSRRFLRFVLSEQCTNYLGLNSDGRIAGVALVNEMMRARTDTLDVLFQHRKGDER